MIFYKIRRKTKKWALDTYSYYKTLITSKFTPKGHKKIFIEIDEITLNRYLYNFIKFFTLNNFTVYIPKNKKVISTLNRKRGEFIYGSWILKEQVKLGKPKDADLVISKEQLSNDYFGKTTEDAFHVPMSEYPGMYRNNIHQDIKRTNGKRKQSVFMSGNMDAAHYNSISKAGFFLIPGRREVAEFLQGKPYYHNIESLQLLRSFKKGGADNKVILIETSKQFRIPLTELKEMLRGFHFYLALPGILIPQSHNLIEAMSVGCIPIIHKTYAGLMEPVLKHMETALVYTSLEELDAMIYQSFNLEDDLVETLHENVREYYDQYLSPGAVVKNIEGNRFSKIYIQAEHISLNLIKN